MALGATIGQFGFERRLGKKAVIFAGIGATLPDLDLVAIRFFSTDSYATILYHRGPSHSLLFTTVLGFILGALLWRYYSYNRKEWWPWVSLMIISLVCHPLLDLFTINGTQLLWPFTETRYAFSAISIIDFFYTAMLLGAVLIGFIFKRHVSFSFKTAGVALSITTAYLFYGLYLNDQALTYAENQLQNETSEPYSVVAYTTIAQPFLRRIVVQFAEEVWVGFVSTWNFQPISWNKLKKAPKQLTKKIMLTRDLSIIDWYMHGQYLIQADSAQNGKFELTIADLRYGLPGQALLGQWEFYLDVDQDGNILHGFQKRGLLNHRQMFNQIPLLFKEAFVIATKE